MSATAGASAPVRWRDVVGPIVAWMKGHVVAVLTAAVIGTIVGFIANVWLLAFVYQGADKVPSGGAAPGTSNTVLGTLFWLLFSTVVFGAVGYFRAVGPAQFAATLRSRPAAVMGLFSGGGNAALAALLWGAMVTLLITVVVGPSIGAVLGVGIFATAFGFVGRLLTIAVMRVVTPILKAIQPSRTVAPSPGLATAGIVGGSLAMVVGIVLPDDPYSGAPSLRLLIAIGCGVAAVILSRPTARTTPLTMLLLGLGGLIVYDLLHPLVAFALDGGSLECGSLSPTDYVLGPCPGKEIVTILSGVGGVATGLGAGPGLAIGNLFGTNPNWGPGIEPDPVRGGAPGEETPGQPGDDDYTETITDAQGNVQRTVTHHTDPVTGDVTVTTTNSQGNVINTITTHVDPISGDVTISRTNSQGQPVVAQVTHVDPITGNTTVTVTNAQGTPVRTTITSVNPVSGDETVTILNPQGTPIRTSTSHVDPVSGDHTVVVTNAQGNPIQTFTTHTDPISGDVTRTILNPQDQPVRTVIDHVDPITGDTTRTTLNPQGTPITTQIWHTDPITGDTTQTILNPQGTPITTQIDHTDPITGDTTRTVLNPQGTPIRTEIDHTDPITGDTTQTLLNPQGTPIRTVIDHTDPITGDVTKTTLNPQDQPIRTDIWHTNPLNGDEVHSSFNPQGQPIGTEIYHTDPITGDTSVTVLNEQGQVEHTYTVHRDPITGLWVPDTSTGSGVGGDVAQGDSIAAGAAAVGQGVGGAAAGVGSGLSQGGQASGTSGSQGQTGVGSQGQAQTGDGSQAQSPPSAGDGSQTTQQTQGGQGTQGQGSDQGQGQAQAGDGSASAPAPPPVDPALVPLTTPGTNVVPASDAFPVLHALVPDVGADGTVGGLSLGQPTISGGSITVNTPLGPASATLGVDDKGHLTATVTNMPKDPTGMVLPTQDEATKAIQANLDAYNKMLDDHGVHLTKVTADNGQLIFTKEPNASPPTTPSPPPPPWASKH